jgi:hypothetical protein
MTTAAENAAPAKIVVHILNFMIFPQMDGGFPVLFRADYLQAGSTDSQNPLMHLGRRHNLAQADRHVAMDPFDQWWKCARKPVDRRLTIPTVIHNAVTAFQADNRRDHLKVNDAQTRAPRP